MSSTITQLHNVLETLQGRWRPVYQEVDGQMIAATVYASVVLELQGNEFTVEKGGAAAYNGTFTLNTLSELAQVSLMYQTSEISIYLGGPRPGVFQLFGDTLKWCFGPVGHSAPTALNTFPGAEAVLTIYQREGSRVEAPTVSLLHGALPW